MSFSHKGFRQDRSWSLDFFTRLASEWSLLVFSFVAIVLVGLFVGSLASSIVPDPWFFSLAGCAGLGFSILHLGRPSRMFRAALNIRSSWVSREIVFFGFFLGAALISLFLSPGPFVAWGAGFAGLFSLISMDMVYRVRGQRVTAVPHSAMATLSSVLVVGLFVASWPLILGAMTAKAVLYGLRRLGTARSSLKINALLPVYRVSLGFVVPPVVWMVVVDPLHPLAVAALAAAEILDRAEFYAELRFLDPELQILRDLPA
jgi:DMSO reductase anchor subunit